MRRGWLRISEWLSTGRVESGKSSAVRKANMCRSGNAAASTLALTPNADYNASEAGIGAASESGASGRSSLLVSNMVVASVCFGLLMVIS